MEFPTPQELLQFKKVKDLQSIDKCLAFIQKQITAKYCGQSEIILDRYFDFSCSEEMLIAVFKSVRKYLNSYHWDIIVFREDSCQDSKDYSVIFKIIPIHS